MGKLYRGRGFSLIELMIVVVIVAILAAIAIPSYRDYVIRGQLVNATTALSAARAKMEQYYQDNRTYLASGSYTPPCSTSATLGYFSISCTGTGSALTASTYTIIAKATTGSVSGASYSIDQTNAQATISLPTAWGSGSSTSCWLIKRGTTC